MSIPNLPRPEKERVQVTLDRRGSRKGTDLQAVTRAVRLRKRLKDCGFPDPEVVVPLPGGELVVRHGEDPIQMLGIYDADVRRTQDRFVH